MFPTHDYPYTNAHEMNLDWILKKIKDLMSEVDTFKVVNNITWGGMHSPSKEYASWTIVDTPDHNGYISIKPVPVGVTVDNSDYWVLVADYSALYANVQSEIDSIKNTIPYVNVKSFGAFGGNIYYNKADNSYYADMAFTEKPVSDVQAFEDAIAYATANNIKTVFIPSGNYYLPAHTFNINENNIVLKGEPGTILISEGLTEGTFFNIQVTGNSEKYCESPVLIDNITFKGNYFKNNMATDGISALTFGNAWIQHRTISHVGICNFSTGIKFNAAIETHMDHCSIIICDTGILFKAETSGYNPIPFYFENGTIELDGYGIYAPNGGYSCLFINNSGLGACRAFYQGCTLIYLDNCRMELAINCLCNNSGSPLPYINVRGYSASDAHAGILANNIEILTTESGYYEALQIFINCNEITRTSNNGYLWQVYNPYTGLSSSINGTNISYCIGDAAVIKLANAPGSRVSIKGRVSYYDEKSPAFGQPIINKDNIQIFNSNISVSGDSISCSGSQSVTITIPSDATEVISHFEDSGNFTVIHEYFHDSTAMNVYYLTNNGDTDPYKFNKATKVPIGANKLKITIPSGTYNNAFIEIV